MMECDHGRIIHSLKFPINGPPLRIEILAENGAVALMDIQRLKARGYHTVESLAFTPKRRLMEVEGITEEIAHLIILGKCLDFQWEAIALTRYQGFSTGTVSLATRRNIVRISSGSQQIDQLIGGGFECSSLTEIFGKNGTGRSIICMNLSVTCQLQIGSGGAGGKCIYIDCSGGFRTDILVRIAQRYNLQPNAVLENIKYVRVWNVDQQMCLLSSAADLMSRERYAALIVDGFMIPFQREYEQRSDLIERQSRIAMYLRYLHRLIEENGVAVVVTNEIISGYGDYAAFGSGKPAGGDTVGHAIHTRIALEKSLDGSERICRLVHSPHLPEACTKFSISYDGIHD